MTCRKNVKTLTPAEKENYIKAVKALKASGKYDQYVKWHADAGMHPTPPDVSPSVRNAAHRGPAFFPWHREFILRFERDLQAEVPGVSLPYWDWAEDAALPNPETAPVWGDDLMGGNGDSSDGNLVKTGPFAYNPADPNTWTIVDEGGNPAGGLQREFGVNIPTLPAQADVSAALAEVPYDSPPWDTSSNPSFRNRLEGWIAGPQLHNRVHVWVGGSMLPMTSPNDPVFFLHHCNVDRLWAEWQSQHPGEGYLPAAGGPEGQKKIDVLHYSALPFAEVIQEQNALGIVSFDQDAYEEMPVTPAGPLGFGAGRTAAKTAISAHTPNPAGTTSIGDGVALAHSQLQPLAGYDVKAIIVLTDGLENTPQYIADVMDSINDRVFAIGLGTPEAISPVALTALTNGTGGYLLMTGTLDGDDYFRLSKYYLQILAGVTNQNIVLDPEGWIDRGQVHRIPFRLSETDISSDVILLTPAPREIRFTLETPSGEIIDPSAAGGNPAVSYVLGDGVSFYHLTLPVPVGGNAAREGIWHAVLSFDDIIIGARQNATAVQTRGLRYSLSVQTYSNLRMRASLSQNSHEPGATLTLRVALTEYGLPVENRATVQAELERPDKTTATLTLAEVEPGVFETATLASMSGIYSFRVLATGRTLRSRTFTREQLLTGAVWKGGDAPLPTGKDDPADCCRRTIPLLKLGVGLLALLAIIVALLLLVALRRCLLG
ncbi:MAG: tyrosinase family protein [Oscillatoria princeps RMCB-10]|jgi:hypothetical protein|nr:tyrosinase family protein [Oscillatoria princeps RMCB-10]